VEVAVSSGTKTSRLPGEWEWRRIGEIGIPVRGGSPRPAGDPRYFDGSFIPWLTVAALTNIAPSQLVVSETATCLTEAGSALSRILDPGTLIIANSGATLGIAKILGIKCCANDGIAAVLGISRKVSPRYLAHFINTKTQYLREVVATGNGQPNLNTALIRSFEIPLPPTRTEQEGIADALSDADGLIESLERLVTKKRQIKQGAMQELLTGKKRLAGFSEKVKAWSLGDLGRWTGGMTPSMRNPAYWHAGTIWWISSGDVKVPRLSATAFAITEAAATRGAATMVPANSIIVVTRSGILRKYLPVALNSVPMAINQDIKALIPDGKVVPDFALQLLAYHGPEILASCLKSGTTVESIEFSWLKAFLVLVPKREEQTAIATVLSDMDAEIDALETKLEKAHQIKQGMMQELLTGRIRLI